ncbi:MAG: YlxR family protein [Dehalococcoidales bacterium]|nr:YlxR family protein [Dehalococcoidales bacterium]
MPVAIKRAPQRTCLACRQVKNKRDLLRVVRTPDGVIEIDTTGKKAGRGAYLCRVRECWEAGLKDDRLEHALKSRLKSSEREQLLSQIKELLKGAR